MGTRLFGPLVALTLSAVVVACAGSAGVEVSVDGAGCVDRSTSALRACGKSPTTLKGVDVSYYQGTVAWPEVKSAGHTFAFVRVSDGLTHPDTRFQANWPAVRAAGMVRGLYQFFRPGQDPVRQARLLIDRVVAAGGFAAGDLPPVLDVETTDDQPAAAVVSASKAWLAEIQAVLGVQPIVYTAAFMSSTLGTALSGYTLWVANYGVSCPALPDGWTAWRFWQTAGDARVPGIAAAVDTNVFDGTASDLAALGVRVSTRNISDHRAERFTDPIATAEWASSDQGSVLGDGSRPSAAAAAPSPCR